MHLRTVVLTILILSLASCDSDKTSSVSPITGIWRAELDLGEEAGVLPFFLEIIESEQGIKAAVWNGEESIVHHEISWNNDTIRMPSPYFDSEIVARVDRNTMTGYFQDYSREGEYRLPFSAKFNLPHRFSFSEMPSNEIDGKWETIFNPGAEDAYKAIGLFGTDENSTQGTFITETGDYRFLEGGYAAGQLKLSTFDGSHAFLFSAQFSGDTLRGTFYSGNHYSSEFIAWRNDSVILQDPYTMTQLSSPNATVRFTGIDLNGDTVNYPSEAYKGKALLLQIMGSWCPNCMDESAFLAPLYSQLKDQNVEVLALAFERQDYETAKSVLEKLKKNLGIEYSLLYAGKASKSAASEILPFLTGIKSYPTLLYIKPDGSIYKIHTGFYGPGTGKYYDIQSKEMLADIDNLVKLSFNQ